MKTIYLILAAIVFLAACETSSDQLSEEDIDRIAERLQGAKTEASVGSQEAKTEPNCRTVVTDYTEQELYTTTELKTSVEEYTVQESQTVQEPYETTETYLATEEYDEPFDFSSCSFPTAFCDMSCSGGEQFASGIEQILYMDAKCTRDSDLAQAYCTAGTLSQHSVSEIYSCPPLKKTREVEKTKTVSEYRDATTYVNVTKYRNVTEPVEVIKYRDVVKVKEETVCS